MGRTLMPPIPAAPSAALIACVTDSCAPGATRTCARSLERLDVFSTPGRRARMSIGGRGECRSHFEQLPRHTALQVRRRVERQQVPLVQQRDARARSASSEYGVAITIVRPAREELGKQLPELAPRHRGRPGRGPVEQQDARLVHERARERQLLLHAPDSRSARRSRNGVSWVISSRRSARPRTARRHGSRRRTRCSRRSSGRRRG